MIGCKQGSDKGTFDPSYALYVSKGGAESFLFVDSTWNMTRSVPVPHRLFNREFIYRKNFIYHVNPTSNYLLKYRLTMDGLFPVDSIALVNSNIEQYHWKNNSDTLLLCNVVHSERDTCYLYEIDTKDFSLIRKSLIPIPQHIKDFDILSVGTIDFWDNKLWIGYAYSKVLNNRSYTTLDTMYFTTLDFSSMKIIAEQKDSRSTYPGGINTIQSYAARVENGDYYFMSGPGIVAGNVPDLPTAIYRRKNADNLVDTDYGIDISQAIKNHAYGFWYIGNGKAVVRAERKDKFKDISDHYLVYQFEYYLIDILSGELSKLSLPLDKGTRKENVVQDGEYLYFGIDDEQNNHAIWQYNKKSQNTNKILTPNQPIDYILRVDKLN